MAQRSVGVCAFLCVRTRAESVAERQLLHTKVLRCERALAQRSVGVRAFLCVRTRAESVAERHFDDL